LYTILSITHRRLEHVGMSTLKKVLVGGMLRSRRS
jgi:hypothetical protein